jgi:hypothetical protein
MSIDKWIFFIGLFFLVLFFFVRKSSTKSKFLLIMALVMIVGPMVLPRQVFGKWNSIRALKDKEISRVILQPSLPGWEVNLTDSVIIIFDKVQINNLLDLLKETDLYIPSHPARIWEVKMTLVTIDNDSLSLKVEKTENNGTVINTHDNKFRKDELAKYLERISGYTTPMKGNSD